ncbi:hypothetical protein NPIL_572651 [Nephila pilipes]|uniref:Uncharacterized protein n=1 Tax=Nephila pilipes TaxID=299642 RepID=A0A8X6IBT3_NEPPI|nr:hypothetical protein NPIL_572651 [Nephila pilipes]
MPKETNKGELTTKEYQEAEDRVIKMVQKESFFSEKDTSLKTFETIRDEEGMIRLKTKIINRKDNANFLYPVVLPAQHEVVKCLILNVHAKNCLEFKYS